jgi:hypothetical protein
LDHAPHTQQRDNEDSIPRTTIVIIKKSGFPFPESRIAVFSFSLQPSAFNLQPSTFNLQPSTFHP